MIDILLINYPNVSSRIGSVIVNRSILDDLRSAIPGALTLPGDQVLKFLGIKSVIPSLGPVRIHACFEETLP
jgi:hypothetical protein